MPGRWVLYHKHERMPAFIVTIYKKGDRTDCGNERGFSRLSIASKIFARIFLNRLSTHITPEVVPETQCGFKGNRSTVDITFCLRQLQEKCIVQDRPLYFVFVDFSKAFDTVGMTELGQEVWMPREVHRYDRDSTYRNDGECQCWRGSLGIIVQTSVLQMGSSKVEYWPTTLFSIFLSAMLDEAFLDIIDGAYIQSRQSADLFNVAHFRAKTKTTEC